MYIGQLAHALVGHDQHVRRLGSGHHGDDLIALLKAYAPHTHGHTAGQSCVIFPETDALSKSCHQEDILLIVRGADADQFVILAKNDSGKTIPADILVFSQRSSLDESLSRSHDQSLAAFRFILLAYRDHRRNFLVRRKLQKIDDSRSSRVSPRFRHLIGLQPEDTPLVGEEHQEGVGIRHQNLVDIIILQGLDSLDSPAAPVLAAEIIVAHPLDISQFRHRDDDVPALDQVLDSHIVGSEADLCPSLITEFVRDLKKFLLDHSQQHLLVGYDRRQLFYKFHQAGVLFFDLASFQTCQSPQTHVHDRLGLDIVKSELFFQFFLGYGNALTGADDPDDLIDIVERDQQSF